MARGRPRIEINQTEFEKLCAMQCTMKEISGFFNCSEDTIERWCERTYSMNFADIFAQKRGTGQISLRRSQFNLAEKNAAMAIFLGKNYLGQRDVVETINTEKRQSELRELFQEVADGSGFDSEKTFNEQAPEDDDN